MNLGAILAIVAVVHVAAACLTALYVSDKGHPWFPVLLATLFLGFPLPLLLVALAPRRGIR